MTKVPICPCEGFIHPQVVFNPPGRSAIAYRVGDYTSFRQALLLPLKDRGGNLEELELLNWYPGADGDLAVQIVEWWAYLADILTFYSDRIANESYLGTADLPESVQRLIQILGYRPRPGIGARGIVAALVNNSKSFTLPQGFQIQSKPGPGKQPQIFELDVDTPIEFADAIAAEPLPNINLNPSSVLLKGTVTTLKVGDELLLLQRNWNKTNNQYALATVQVVQSEKDPKGKTNTRLSLGLKQSGLPNNAEIKDYRLLKSLQSAHVWQYPTGSEKVISNVQIHLDSLVRQIKVGDPILLQSFNSTQLIQVTQYKEVVWYANPKNNNPTLQVDPPAIPIPIPHTQLGFTSTLTGDWDSETARATALVYYDWQDVGELIATPATTFSKTEPQVNLIDKFTFPPGKKKLPLLLEDTNGNGISATVSLSNSPPKLQLSDLSNSSFELTAPLQMLFNLLSVSRGQTAPVEVLGSGDASIAGQEFVLQNSPLTYLVSGDSTSGSNYKSTLRIWVDGIEWQEVPSFYGQSADARIFVTREDENQHTHVLFGDGVNGARLSSGVNNVLARYRYGSGKEAPDAGTLTVISKPYPNLKTIRNPVPVGGGADPEPAAQIRRYAPRSVLTFGRAVSGDDYEAIAAQTPGVARAKVYWTWDATQQRSLVKLYVGDDDSAVGAATIALKGTADPNRSVVVELAQPLLVQLTLTLRIEAARIPEIVIAAVQDVLLHPDNGLFGVNAVQIGQAIYQSQIYATCMQVPGVLAVHGGKFQINSSIDVHYRHDPGEGKFYHLPAANLTLYWKAG
ncbi:baseplate J/gp47 family protein [Nostoc sp. WHI]|uniref:baseplate J/gp47 family protein n=1 Tax=Nostoc sp. WHI TaxID=2650611 RepID=UPI0018C851F0|nr:baseplate J/gp47 family protein [Nostoc sp. WHI]MBG1269467.1 hypothetical protein [Nostoc sp. WHI]